MGLDEYAYRKEANRMPLGIYFDEYCQNSSIFSNQLRLRLATI